MSPRRGGSGAGDRLLRLTFELPGGSTVLKKILIGLVALVVVLVIAAIAVVTLVDVDRFKPQIEQAVADRYNRKLQIGGKLSLSVFPRIALTLPTTTLSDPIGSPDAGQTATVKAAHVSVGLLPLLRGEIIAERITIDGLNAKIARRADGSLSIDDLLGRSGATARADGSKPEAGKAKGTKPAPQTGAGKPAGSGLPRLDIGGITLSDARIEFDDQQGGSTAVIDDLDLETGRITSAGRTPLSLSLNATTSRPKAALTVSLKGEADYDLDVGRFGARDLAGTVKGSYDTTTIDDGRLNVASISAEPARGTIDLAGLTLGANGKLSAGAFEAKVDAPRLKVANEAASGETLTATVKLAGEQVVDAKVTASDISGKATALTIARLVLDATTTQGERKVVAQLATPVNGDTAAGSWKLPALAGQVVVTDPKVPNGTATLNLSGQVDANTTKQAVHADLAANGEGTTLKAKVGVNGFSQPKISFDVQADRLDIDRFVPPPSAEEKAAQKNADKTEKAAEKTSRQPAQSQLAAGGRSADEVIDLSGLRTLTVDGKIAIGQLHARGIEASQLSAAIKAQGGQIDVAPVSAQLYQGKLGASASIHAGSTPQANQFSANIDLAQISIAPLLKAVADNDMLEGRGNVKLSAQTGGATVPALKQALGGKGSINLVDGAIKGINLAETIRSARNLLSGGASAENKPSDNSQKTDFTALDATFVITKGVVSSNDLDVKSPLIRIAGEGTADLVNELLNYTVRASVVATSSGQGGKELSDLNGLTVPVRLTGPLAGPTWQIDWVTAGREMLKSRAADELKERLKVDELQDKAKDKARERVGDALKGLLGR